MDEVKSLEAVGKWIIDINGINGIKALAKEVEGSESAVRFYKDLKWDSDTDCLPVAVLLTKHLDRLLHANETLRMQGISIDPYTWDYPSGEDAEVYHTVQIFICESEIWKAAEKLRLFASNVNDLVPVDQLA